MRRSSSASLRKLNLDIVLLLYQLLLVKLSCNIFSVYLCMLIPVYLIFSGNANDKKYSIPWIAYLEQRTLVDHLFYYFISINMAL